MTKLILWQNWFYDKTAYFTVTDAEEGHCHLWYPGNLNPMYVKGLVWLPGYHWGVPWLTMTPSELQPTSVRKHVQRRAKVVVQPSLWEAWRGLDFAQAYQPIWSPSWAQKDPLLMNRSQIALIVNTDLTDTSAVFIHNCSHYMSSTWLG